MGVNDGVETLGVDWSLVATGWTPWLIVPFTIAIVALGVRLYTRETAPLEKAGRTLRILRGAVLALLVLMLMQPIVHHAARVVENPVIAVLCDTSASMSIRDENEPAEQTVRAAVVLGLLPETSRETRADLIADRVKNAQGQADAALNAIRIASQQAGSAGAGAEVASARVRDARRFLTAARTLLTEAQTAGKELKGVQGSSPQRVMQHLQRSLDTLARLEKDLSELPIPSRDAPRLLGDALQTLKTLSEDLLKLYQDSRQLQDAYDRALAKSNDAPVKSALESVRKLSRSERVTMLLEKRVKTETGARARIIIYDFDTDLRAQEKNQKDPKVVEAAAPQRNDTDLATPLLRLAERHAQESLAAVVMFSDGGHTTGPPPEDAARALSGRGIPVFTAGIGNSDAPRDVCVARLDGTLSVFLEETIRLTALIRTNGYKGKKLKLALARGSEVLQRREIPIPESGWLRETFELPASVPGANVFTVTAEAQAGEATLTNNAAEAVVDVAADKLRALVVDEWPRWESRYLCSMLRRERKMDLTERWLQSGPPGRSAIPEDEKALNAFDVIAIGDVGPERLDDEAQRRLASFVADRGGCLILIAGPKAMPLSYSAGSIADLLPIRPQPLSGAAAPMLAAGASRQSRVKLDAAGERSDITAVLRDPVLNEQVWPLLPELQWVARPAFAKPGAQSLLITADARGDCVVAHHHFGIGRVLYIGTDETWRWRLNIADRIHAVFWSQALRWGTGTRLTGGDRLKVGAGQRQIRPGESVEILARPLDANGRVVTAATVTAELDSPTRKQRVQLQSVPSSGGLFRGTLAGVPAGIHDVRIRVDAPGFEKVSESVQVLARESAGQEGVELARQNARLAALASAGGGRSMDWMEAPALLRDLSGQRRERTLEATYALWASYPMLLLIAGLLVAEWILRKRAGLM